MRLPQRPGIAGLHPPAEILAADEGRVADDEFRLRPARQARVPVAVDLDLFAAGIGAGDGAAVLVANEALAVVGENRVVGGLAEIDVAERLQDRLGGLAAEGAAVPLKEADPTDQVGG